MADAGFAAIGSVAIGSVAIGSVTVGSVAGAVLAVVFVWAAAAKLLRPAATAEGFAAMGVPAAAFASRAVPGVELAVAVALLAVPRIGGVVALALLAGFSVALLRALGSGATSGCNCFGRARVEPVSRRDLVRNAALAGLAVLAALVP